MHPAQLRQLALAAACVAALAVAGCGRHIAANAPITFAPADTPYLLANLKPAPGDVTAAWGGDNAALITVRVQQLQKFATLVGAHDPQVTKVLEAIHDELANAHSSADLEHATGFTHAGLYAVYGVGDVPVARIQLGSAEAFKAFWARVEKRAGITAPVARIGSQDYWTIGSDAAKVRLLIAIEGDQLVATAAPANADAGLLEQLLGLHKPSSNASGRLLKVNHDHGYGDFGSGYLDLPRLFANLFDGKDATTQAFAKDIGGASLANPACASEFAGIAHQVPLISVGMQDYSAKEVRYSLDAQLSPALLGALTALKQPVPGMAETADASMFDFVLALPLKKWQAFFEARAKAIAEKTYQCPALQSLTRFAKTAANPPVQLPPEAASLLGMRFVLDKWEAGPKISARALVASSDPAALAGKIQQTLPQFALKTIPTDGKPVAFDLPPKVQAMLGSGNQGWIAANGSAIAVGVGAGGDQQLAAALDAPAGNGDALMRMHIDGKMYGVLANWFERFGASAPPATQVDFKQSATMFRQLANIIGSANTVVKLDAKGLHIEGDSQHH